MFSDPPRPGNMPSDPDADPALADARREIAGLARGDYELLGPLGRDRGGEYAFLARSALEDRLVVLKRGGAGGRSRLEVIDRLDDSVPPPAGACPICQAPFTGWDPACANCGADLAGSAPPAHGPSRQQLLAAIREAAPGYEVVGEMARAAGGAPVYFARESKGGTIVVLRLDQDTAPGKSTGLTVAATRMMRPKLLYGAAGLSSGSAGPASWAPQSTPPGASRPGITPPPGGSTGGRVCPQCGETFGPEHRFCPRDGTALRAKEPTEDLVGQVIAERYHVLSKLGEGGMGRVYLAEHVRMGRRCAVKVMNPMLLYDPDSVSRFNREAANASGINHPNVVAIYDFGESGDLVYLAMEFVEGESLAALLEREKVLPQRRAAEIARQVADGLSAAHELGIVHRDLKPDNVMLSRSRSGKDVVKVVDFGIAKATRGGKQTVTRTGYIVGTPAYMSPEQILGDALDPRSDIYSLGCMLYEMLTGRRAFADSSGEVSIRQRLSEAPPRPRRVKQGLSPKLDGIVTRAMARVPDQRFQSAADIRDALAAALPEMATRSWKRWLPWHKARDPEGAAPTVERTPIAGPASLPGAQDPFTAPVPLGWTEVEQGVPQAAPRATTVLRHRSARPAPGRGAWIAGAGVAAVLAVFGIWQLLKPDTDEVVVDRGQVILPATGVSSPPPDSAAAPAAPPAAAPGPDTSASTPPPSIGAVWFAEPLPPGARVLIDGQEIGVGVDGSIPVPLGKHSLRIEAAGFRAATRSVSITSGETDTVSLRLAPAATALGGEPAAPRPPAPPPAPAPSTSASGTVLVAGSLPPDAEVAVDGQIVSSEGGRLEIPSGSHWLRLSAPGYRADSSRVQVTRGVETRWDVPHLVPIPKAEPIATIQVLTPDTVLLIGSSLTLDAVVKDEAGTYLDRPVSWESGNPTVAAIGADGRLTAKGPGRTYVRARTGSRTDSLLVTVPMPPPKPSPSAPAPRPPRPGSVPAAPTAANIEEATAACVAALGSGNERQIVDAYQAKTAQDVTNLRKILDVAIRPGADFKAAVADSEEAEPAQGGKVPLRLRLSWRNNAGVNKKKEAPFVLEMSKTAEGWRMASCRAAEKLGL